MEFADQSCAPPRGSRARLDDTVGLGTWGFCRMLFPSCKSLKIRIFPLLCTGALLCIFAVNLFAHEQPPQNSNNNDRNEERTETQSPPRRNDPSLQLGVGDLVELTVYDVPDMTTKTRISSTGDIYCPLIGPTHVAGLTIEEASQLIEKRLSNFLKNPYVSLFVDEYAAQGASILGEVAKPGVYPVLGEQHLFDMISASGGLTEKAGHSITVTHRSDPDNPVTVPVSRNLSDNPDSNVRVFPRDTIVVRKADIVYVVGDVNRPSGFLMDASGLTVLQAIALAGGTTRTAKLGGVKILHKGRTGGVETPVQLKKILQAKAPDLSLEANDILIVPSSAGRILAGRALEAAMQAATIVSAAAVVP
jgi:polysaccharide export outer membrane protein